MQKYLFLFLFFFIVNGVRLANAQAWIYHPMVTDTSIWVYGLIDEETGKIFCRSESYRIRKDTVVEGVTWKLLKNEFSSSPGNLIRENAKHIYYRRKNSLAPSGFWDEILLYDFSKGLNDTIRTTKYGAAQIDTLLSKVLEIDSVLTLKGFRKRFVVQALNWGWGINCTFPQRFWFVEDMGSPIYLVYTDVAGIGPGGPCEHDMYITGRISGNDTLLLPPDDCLHVGMKEIEKSQVMDFSLKKNPLTYTACFNAVVKGKLELYSASGTALSYVDFNHEKEVETMISNTFSGLLIWKFYDELSKKYHSGKMILPPD